MKRVSATPGCPGCANPLLQARKFPHDPTTLSCAPKASNPSGRQLPLPRFRDHGWAGRLFEISFYFAHPVARPGGSSSNSQARLFSPASAPSLVAWARPGQSIQEARSPGHSSLLQDLVGCFLGSQTHDALFSQLPAYVTVSDKPCCATASSCSETLPFRLLDIRLVSPWSYLVVSPTFAPLTASFLGAFLLPPWLPPSHAITHPCA
ncbi:hypothetical protein A9K55_004093 [Cordyceps militaris]|uniref:Uncharacterized protein n=1 Tax=Cordyceps militaris TaxID=73501 RepID=A0A2H4SPS7_CORMI|nr:hypothetical protein A9K55_004093 [Cordyceps militaris]